MYIQYRNWLHWKYVTAVYLDQIPVYEHLLALATFDAVIQIAI